MRQPGFEFGSDHPQSACRAALLARFPDQHGAIERWFADVAAARHAAFTLLGARGMPDWRAAAARLRPGLAMVVLYLGYEGDIASAGASAADVWVYESDDIGAVWRAPSDDDAPGLFVSFPSLKDPAHDGPPTAEVLAVCDARAFDPWLHAAPASRPRA